MKRSLWYGVRDLASEFTGRAARARELRSGEFWAVNDVSFQLRRGECLGLIGPNGAGKSTLLKMLNGLIKPDSGRIRARGRVGALIELGAGFHPVLTGRENIYVNGSILGMTKREIDRKFDQIVDFAEIGDAIDAPVRTYSSGMRVRLGFAIAAHCEPEILLIDEVLAVGDIRFRMKCYDHLLRSRDRGTGVVLVSHSPIDIQRMTNRVLVLSYGQSAFCGSTDRGMVIYDRVLLVFNDSVREAMEACPVRTLTLTCNRRDSTESPSGIVSGDDVEVEIALDLNSVPISARFVIHIDGITGRLGSFGVIQADGRLIEITDHSWRGRFTISELPLGMGHYVLSACVYGETIRDHIASFPSAGTLDVAGPSPDAFGFGQHGRISFRASSCTTEPVAGNSAQRSGFESAS